MTAPKRKLSDYAGIAALVTATGAVAFGVIDRMVGDDHKRDRTSRLARSVFNASRERIAVLEYRVAELEELCGDRIEVRDKAAPPVAAAARRPAAVRPLSTAVESAEAEVGDEDAAAVASSDGAGELAENEKTLGASVSFDAIQQIVDGGNTYKGVVE